MSRNALLKASLYVVSGLILAGIFTAYLRPEFMLDLANRIMFCFQ